MPEESGKETQQPTKTKTKKSSKSGEAQGSRKSSKASIPAADPSPQVIPENVEQVSPVNENVVAESNEVGSKENELKVSESKENEPISGVQSENCNEQEKSNNEAINPGDCQSASDLMDENNNKCTSNGQTNEHDILQEIDENIIIELKEAFDLFDIDSDGLITHSDLKRTFISLGQDVSDADITNMLDEGSKPMDVLAFIKMVCERGIHLDHGYVMSNALSEWDRDGSGLISFTRIHEDLTGREDRFTEKEADIALEEAPVVLVKGNKMIDYKEFSDSLCCFRKKN